MGWENAEVMKLKNGQINIQILRITLAGEVDMEMATSIENNEEETNI